MFNCDQFSLVRGHDLVPSKPHTQNLPYPRDYFNPIFCIGRVGDKNNLGNFFKMGFGTKKYHFCVEYFFYNSHRVKSSLLSLELSFRSLLQGRQTSK